MGIKYTCHRLYKSCFGALSPWVNFDCFFIELRCCHCYPLTTSTAVRKPIDTHQHNRYFYICKFYIRKSSVSTNDRSGSSSMSRLSPRVQLIIILTALAFIPLIYASLLVCSVKDPTGSLDTMSAAIINEDSPAAIDDEELTLADDLTNELLESDSCLPCDTMTQIPAVNAITL